MQMLLKPGQLALNEIRQFLFDPSYQKTELRLDPKAHEAILASYKMIQQIVSKNKTVYGINTGFGLLANTSIPAKDLEHLQKSIVLSHAAGTGDLLSDTCVRLMLLLKINSLARGYSGVRLETIEALIQLLNAKVYPCIPSQGSVGASGDLAPLAHMAACLIGVGEARHEGKIIPALAALQIAGLKPLELQAKEGLALLNGTQASTALALLGVFAAENHFNAALFAGALSVEASLGSAAPFDERIHALRGHPDQSFVAKIYRDLLNGSELNRSHASCEKVQDPYSLRCQPQVMGPCLSHLKFARESLAIEANAVTDNPLIFSETEETLSGGNFHAEVVAMAADTLALSIAEVGALSERRIALLIDPHFSSLPAFLVNHAGLNSGFMIAQVTAAALASENKSLAHPASIDSLPTSANQEDHVSMATFAARRLLNMAENTAGIVAIELLAAAQGIDFRRPLKTSPALEKIHGMIRSLVPFYDTDRYFAPDLEKIKTMVREGQFQAFI